MLNPRLFFSVFAALLLLTTLAEATPIERKVTKVTNPLAPGYALAASASATAKSDVFCKSFRTACVKAALETKDTGSVTIREGCQRNGKKYSNSYSFVCKAGSTDLTGRVLRRLEGGYTVTTTKGATVVATGTSIVATIGSPIVTQDTTQISTATIVVPATQTIVTSTTVLQDPEVLLEAKLVPSSQKRATSLDDTAFCSSFSASCVSECKRVGSSRSNTVCHKGSSNLYSLQCKCKNGKKETQHALVAAMNKVHYKTVSKVSTSTSIATGVVVKPTTVTRTVQATSTLLTTATLAQVTSTNTIVVALPTGIVNAIEADGTDLGGLTNSFGAVPSTLIDVDPTEFMLVKNADGSYSLSTLDGTATLGTQAVNDYSIPFILPNGGTCNVGLGLGACATADFTPTINADGSISLSGDQSGADEADFYLVTNADGGSMLITSADLAAFLQENPTAGTATPVTLQFNAAVAAN